MLKPRIQVSSTVFSHVAWDSVLEPLGKFADEEAKKKYPPIKTGLQVRSEYVAVKAQHPGKLLAA